LTVSCASPPVDTVNNVEQIIFYLDPFASLEFLVKVTPRSLSQPQDFALFIENAYY
jgi:hypothetical protein